jgi:hypothetical protein
MGCHLASYHEITIFQAVVPPQMRNNLLNRSLIQLPCLQFFPHLCKKIEYTSTIEQLSTVMIISDLFAQPPLPPSLWCIKLTTHDEATFRRGMEMLHCLLVNMADQKYISEQESSPESLLTHFIKFCRWWHVHWDSKNWGQLTRFLEVDRYDLTKYHFNLQRT